MRAALEAISVAWLTAERRNVSTICASTMGARMRSNGSLAKTAVPSGTAQTSPVKRRPRRKSAKAGVIASRSAGTVARKATSSSVKRSRSRYSTTRSIPMARR